jgi:hypothetical protein
VEVGRAVDGERKNCDHSGRSRRWLARTADYCGGYEKRDHNRECRGAEYHSPALGSARAFFHGPGIIGIPR